MIVKKSTKYQTQNKWTKQAKATRFKTRYKTRLKSGKQKVYVRDNGKISAVNGVENANFHN